MGQLRKSPIRGHEEHRRSGGGGSITAALFLKRFIEKEETKWAHLDIAGPVWDDKKGGATEFGANTLARWIAGQNQVRATQCGMNSLSRSDRTRDDSAAAATDDALYSTSPFQACVSRERGAHRLCSFAARRLKGEKNKCRRSAATWLDEPREDDAPS